MGKYDDIIKKKRPVTNHARMGRKQRAKQFAPFEALKGFEECVEETKNIQVAKWERINISDEPRDE